MPKYILEMDNPSSDQFGPFSSMKTAVHHAYNGGYVEGTTFSLLRDINGARYQVRKIKVTYTNKE